MILWFHDSILAQISPCLYSLYLPSCPLLCPLDIFRWTHRLLICWCFFLEKATVGLWKREKSGSFLDCWGEGPHWCVVLRHLRHGPCHAHLVPRLIWNKQHGYSWKVGANSLMWQADTNQECHWVGRVASSDGLTCWAFLSWACAMLLRQA